MRSAVGGSARLAMNNCMTGRCCCDTCFILENSKNYRNIVVGELYCSKANMNDIPLVVLHSSFLKQERAKLTRAINSCRGRYQSLSFFSFLFRCVGFHVRTSMFVWFWVDLASHRFDEVW